MSDSSRPHEHSRFLCNFALYSIVLLLLSPVTCTTELFKIILNYIYNALIQGYWWPLKKIWFLKTLPYEQNSIVKVNQLLKLYSLSFPKVKHYKNNLIKLIKLKKKLPLITKFFTVFIIWKKGKRKLKNYLIFQRKDNQHLHIPYRVKVYLQCMLLFAFSYSLNIVYQIIKEKLHHVQFFFCPPEPIKRKNNFRGTG